MCTLSRSAGQDGRVNNVVDTTFDRIKNGNVLKYPQVRIYKRSSQELVLHTHGRVDLPAHHVICK